MAASTPLPEANTSFCLSFFKELSDENKAGNIFFSPFSISSALAMVLLGARGNTATQMSEVLCFTEAEEPQQGEGESGEQQSVGQTQMQSRMQTRQNLQMHQQIQKQSRLPDYLRKFLKPGQQNVHEKFAQMMDDLIKEDAPYALDIANRLYGEQSYQFIQDYLDDVKKHYKAELESLDFRNNNENARIHINEWVEKQTKDKIKNLLGPGSVPESTKLVLVNAIYFKGTWADQFDEDRTVDSLFRTNKKDTVPVKMMHQKKKCPLFSDSEAKFQVLELPYKGKTLSMLIFLPNEIEDDTTGLEELEREMTYEKFVEWTSLKIQVEVQVGLPRFKMEETYKLNDVLISMGMGDAFSEKLSDFSGMCPNNDLVVSKVVHKSFVDVNEVGTEAAAAAAVIMIERTSLRPLPKKFIADHPFLFFIRHNPTQTVLFAGRCSSPA